MKYDKLDALDTLKPNSLWQWQGTDYSGLNWVDSSQT